MAEKIERFVAKVRQDGVVVAQVESQDKDDCEREIMRYARQYMEDGLVKIERNYPSPLRTVLFFEGEEYELKPIAATKEGE